jgi:hypothetical protein
MAKRILIQTTSDRGRKQRASTHQDWLHIEVYYLDSAGDIRKTRVHISRIDGTDSIEVNTTAGIIDVEGSPAQKLSLM